MFEVINGKYDQAARDCFKKNKNTCISWWLSASYAYYIRYESLLSDEAFDKMAKYILDNYNSLEHQHKHLITKDMLSAGSGYNLKKDDYPLRVQVTADSFIRELHSGITVA
jgi:NAD-dependent DNA ligase